MYDMTLTPDRLRPQPKANPDKATESIRFLVAKGYTALSFDTEEAFKQSEEGRRAVDLGFQVSAVHPVSTLGEEEDLHCQPSSVGAPGRW